MHVPDSYIKNIAIRLRNDFELDNTPLIKAEAEYENTENKKKFPKPFIGRTQLLAKFNAFLKSNQKRGVFLVTGYRGMGKTSFVNKVVHTYKANHKDSEKVKPINLTLAQNNLSEFDILKMIVISVFDIYTKKHEQVINSQKSVRRNFPFYLSYILLAFFLSYCLLFKNDAVTDFITNTRGIKTTIVQVKDNLKIIGYILFIAGLGLFIWLITHYWIKLKDEAKKTPLKRISWLVERCHTNVSEEWNDSKELNIGGIKTTLGFLPKRTKSYPIATTKEIEYELKEFLKAIRQDEGLEFVFIFDELDKIESGTGFQYIHEELEKYEANGRDNDHFTQLRNRKETVINVIASLKNFFTSADARFVFIAGREIFDASLADISDKQSSVNSIFTYIFNIESWLKDDGLSSPNSSPSLSTSIETYLNEIIDWGKTGITEQENSLFKSISVLVNENDREEKQPEFYKMYFIVQAFVAYLVYRSNGSPKKFKKAIHDFVLIVNDKNGESFGDSKTKGKLFIPNETAHTGETDGNEGMYLYFNYLNQYRIGFINYLYRPFLLQKGRSFKMYSDNTNIAIPYLFDHLIKFHSFAFSFSNLELIPEILSASKTPYLKQHLGEIVNYLKANHLRETDIELFDYKFYSRTQNEIVFLSKVYEEEAAAFNFTLDESYPVKMLVNNKIKELRSIYARFQSSSDIKNQQIFSIAYLNGNLGDLHFFDQEFDNAIGCYSDAIRPINNIEIETMNFRGFITLTRNKLKIGLCFEKINSYEEALAFYSDATQDAKRFISFRLNNSNIIKEDDDVPYLYRSRSGEKGNLYLTSSLNDLLQIVIQCFLAKITIQEKMGLEGITTPKVQIAVGGFLTLAANVGLQCGTNSIINANAFLHLGNMLYYKNSSQRTDNTKEEKVLFPKVIERKIEKLRENRKDFMERPDINLHLNKREPILAFQMYLLGLDEIIQSRGAFKNITCNKKGEVFIDGDEKPELDLLSNYKKYNVLTVYFNSIESYLNIGTETGSQNENSNEILLGPHLRYIATLLSSIGDCILSMYKLSAGDNKKIDSTNFRKLTIADLFKTEQFKVNGNIKNNNIFYTSLKKNDENQDQFTVMDVLRCYYLSGMFFKKYGRSASCGFQFKKILHVLRIVFEDDKEDDHGFLNFLKANILKPIREIALQNIGNTDSHIVNKTKEILNKESEANKATVDNFLANHAEFKEAELIFACIQIKCKKRDLVDIKRLVSHYNMYSTQYTRILELDLYSKYVETLQNINKDEQAISYLFSLLSILRLLAIDGQDFMISPSYIAYTHYRLAEYIKKNRLAFNEKNVRDNIEKLLGGGAYSSLDKNYHYAMAKDNYEKTIQLHTAGKEYKKTINDMIYLEDDFNDNAYHFGAAIDRYLMVNNAFTKHIDLCI